MGGSNEGGIGAPAPSHSDVLDQQAVAQWAQADTHVRLT